MERVEPIEFLFSSLAQKSNPNAYCFNRCIKREQLDKELSKEQENCLGNCTNKYQQAYKIIIS